MASRRRSLLAVISLLVGMLATFATLGLAVSAMTWGPQLLVVAAVWGGMATTLLVGSICLLRRPV